VHINNARELVKNFLWIKGAGLPDTAMKGTKLDCPVNCNVRLHPPVLLPSVIMQL